MTSGTSRLYLGYYAGIAPKAPGPITDLAAATTSPGRVLLTWTAVGDDADVGTAMKYDLRLATSAAAAQGLVFASNIYELHSPVLPLPGGATVQFRYQDPADLSLEPLFRIYKFSPGQGWLLLANLPPNTLSNTIAAPVQTLSLFALMLRDTKAPTTALNFIGRRYAAADGRVFGSTSTRFELSAQDPPLGGGAQPLGAFSGTGVTLREYRVDTATSPFSAFTLPFGLEAGLHALQYRSTDKAGNVEPLKSAAVAVDGAAPTAGLSAEGPFMTLPAGIAILSTTGLSGGLPELIVRVEDPLIHGGGTPPGAGAASVRYALDAGPFQSTASSFTLALPLGAHRLALIAEDNVGNVLDRSADPFTIIVGDTEPPRIAISSPSAGGRFVAGSSTISIHFAVSDNFDPAPAFEAFLLEREDRGTPRGNRTAVIEVQAGQAIAPSDLDDGTWELMVSATDFVLKASASSALDNRNKQGYNMGSVC